MKILFLFVILLLATITSASIFKEASQDNPRFKRYYSRSVVRGGGFGYGPRYASRTVVRGFGYPGYGFYG